MYLDLIQHHHILSTKLLNPGFLQNPLILSFKKFFGRYQQLVETSSVRCVLNTKDCIGNYWFKIL